MLVHGLRSYFQELGGLAEKFAFGKVCMTVCGGLKKNVEDTGPDTVVGIGENPRLLRDLVCHFKAYARNIVCQTVGIFPDNAVELWAVFLIDLGSQVQGDTIVLKKHHSLAHLFFVLNLLCNSHGHFLADALDLSEAFRLFFHNTEGVGFEAPDNPGSHGRADAFDGPGT